MSGHSHWHNIREKKGKEDAKRSKIFSKLSKVVSIAARDGGDPEENIKLKQAIEKSKEADMPAATIDRAIKRGTGEIEGMEYKEVTIEAYGPGNSAIIVDGITDNSNRTIAEMKRLLSDHSGKMAQSGSVSYLFEKKGLITIDLTKEENSSLDRDELELTIIDAGAEDMSTEHDLIEIYSEVNDINKIKSTLESNGIRIESAQPGWRAKTEIDVSDREKEKIEKLFMALDNHDDIQEIYTNVAF